MSPEMEAGEVEEVRTRLAGEIRDKLPEMARALLVQGEGAASLVTGTDWYPNPSEVREAIVDGRENRAIVCQIAGAGTRWTGSMNAENAAIAKMCGITMNPEPPVLPRSLAKVGAMFEPPTELTFARRVLEMASVFASRVVIVYGGENSGAALSNRAAFGREIEGLPAEFDFVEQPVNACLGKVAGHGDAMMWVKQAHPELFAEGREVMALFGTLPYARQTIGSTLLLGKAVMEAKLPVGALWPCNYMDATKYPIVFDGNGVPIRAGHAKMMGLPDNNPGYSNVGVWWGRGEWWVRAMSEWDKAFEQGWYPPNNAGQDFGELAMDHFMIGGIAGKLGVSEEEPGMVLAPPIARADAMRGDVKAISDIPEFVANVTQIDPRDRSWARGWGITELTDQLLS